MKQNQNIETTVGIFLLFGIAIICTLILFFGEVQNLFKPTYNLTVTFTDASGLLKGSDVYLSGAQIGKVTTDPKPIPDKQEVEVNLKIDRNVVIRKDAKYVIGSSGLLGDKFVVVEPKEYKAGDEKAPLVQDGDRIEGSNSTDLTTLMNSAEPLIEHANHIATQLDDMITRLNGDVLSNTSTDDLKDAITKLKDMLNNGDIMMKNANDIMAQIKSGKGAVGRLISDRQVGDNLAAFIANLKEHGPVFYKDDSADKDDGSRKKK